MRDFPLPAVLIVAGPTCSGKSALAMRIAADRPSTVINADSMQVYAELRVLTARPTEQDETLIPHRLYGVRPAAEPGSAAWWRQAAMTEIDAAHQAGRLPILCGGTGLYFQALQRGLADIPDPGSVARDEARALLAQIGAPALHARLMARDPDTARRLTPEDGQRVARAWEVLAGTGRGLAAWQAVPPTPAPYRFVAIQLDPPRAELRNAIAARFDAMLAAGAVEEVRQLLALGLDPSLPAMRAHGVPELASMLRHDITQAEAARRVGLATGQYTKRQATWLRHHPLSAHQICVSNITSSDDTREQDSERIRRFVVNNLPIAA